MGNHRLQTALIAVVCSAATAVLISSASVFADGNPATDAVAKLIPYSGILERNGVAVTGVIEMTFKIYDADVVDPIWTETQVVSVYGGRFSVLLGSSDPPSGAALRDAITNADDLYLEIVLKEGVTEIPLSNKQRFLPVPYALWTTASTDFVIHGADNDGAVAALEINSSGGQQLLADGNEIDSNGTLNLNSNSGNDVMTGGSLEVGDRLYVRGTDFELGGSDAGRGDGGVALVRQTGDQLLVNYSGTFSGGVSIEGGADGDVVVNGPDNNGARAALHVVAGSQEMLIDGNKLDSIGDFPQISLSPNTQAGAKVHGPLEADPKLVEMALLDFAGDSEYYTTAYSTDEWNCMIGSFEYLDGDIMEDDAGNILRAITYRESGVWKMYADFRSHNNHEDHKIGLVCFRTGISNLVSWW